MLPTPTNQVYQTVPHPPTTAPHRLFSHKEYYRHRLRLNSSAFIIGKTIFLHFSAIT
nr:MAG TPA: hypothetical protein [Caudoviricetes sp.]